MTLRAQGLSFAMAGKPILDDASLVAAPGKLVGLIGPNGAGKTTLLRIVSGLLAPGAGKVELDGEDVHRMPDSVRAKRMAYVPQERAVHWPVTVRDLVGLGRLPFRRPFMAPGMGDSDAVEQALAMMDIEPLAGRSALTLSGGELARVLIARAFAQTPEVLLADEPAAGLDPAHQLRVLGLIHDAVRNGMSAVIVLHDLTLAARFCDTLVLLDKGQVCKTGTPAQVLKPKNLLDVYGYHAHLSKVEGSLAVTPVGLPDKGSIADAR